MSNLEIHHLEDKSLLSLLQIVIKNGNLFGLVNECSRFRNIEDIEKGIAWLLREGIIVQVQNGYEITTLGSKWRLSVWRKLGMRGIYRYLYPLGEAEGLVSSFATPFLPQKFDYLKKG